MSKKPSKARCLKISNDISEGICDSDPLELMQVVEFWRDELDKVIQKQNALHAKMLILMARFITSRK